MIINYTIRHCSRFACFSFLPNQNLSTYSTSNLKPLNILIADCYQEHKRQQFQENQVPFAYQLYQEMLTHSTPRPVTTDVIFPADTSSQWVIPDLSVYDGLVWTGSSMSVYDNSPECHQSIVQHQELFQAMLEANIPSFGTCWGAQLAANMTGGQVQLSPFGREYGITHNICLTPEGRAHPLYDGKPSVFQVFNNHGDEITHLSSSGLILASNHHCRGQAITVRLSNNLDYWGTQYHPEYNLTYLAQLTNIRRERLCQQGFFRHDSQIDQYIEDLMELDQNPEERHDLLWKYGISLDLLDQNFRWMECRNWIRYQL